MNIETIIGTNQKTLAIKLAEAIKAFNIVDVGNLLSENGNYEIQDKDEEEIGSNKEGFLEWLNNCFDEFISVNEDCNHLDYTIDQCLHCKIGKFEPFSE
jgi:hypothetical protein